MRLLWSYEGATFRRTCTWFDPIFARRGSVRTPLLVSQVGERHAQETDGCRRLVGILTLGTMAAAMAITHIDCPPGYSQCSIYYDDGSGQLKYIGEACCSDD